MTTWRPCLNSCDPCHCRWMINLISIINSYHQLFIIIYLILWDGVLTYWNTLLFICSLVDYQAFTCSIPSMSQCIHHLTNSRNGRTEPSVDDVPKLQFVEQCFREALRLYSPVTGISRDSAYDTLLGGHRIYQGERSAASCGGFHKWGTQNGWFMRKEYIKQI